MSAGQIAPSAPAGAAVSVPPSDHGHSPERWPLHDTITLGALDGAVPSARARLRQLLWEWDHPELAQDASVVISELVTNAVIASASLRPAIAPVQVWLGSDTSCILLTVADASPRLLARLNLGPEAEAGRGLALVEALTSRWGWHPSTAAGLVKFVWAEWRLPSQNGERPIAAHPSPSHAG
jgi:anti-sigma regulatory factor (Ser/Thr protein kinase)